MTKDSVPLQETDPSPVDHAPVESVSSKPIGQRLLMPMIIAVLVYGALLLYADADAIIRHATQVPVTTLLVATGLSLSNYAVRFLRWQYYLHRLQISVPTYDSGLIFIAGFSMSITPGKLGEVVKSLLLKQGYGVSMAVTAPIVVAERVTDLSALLVLGALGLFGLAGGFWSGVLALVMVGLLFALVVSRPLGNLAINIATRLPFLSKRRDRLKALQESLLTLNQPFPFAVSLLMSIVAWGLQCIGLNVLAWSFSDVSLSIQEGLLAYAAPLLAGTLALIPGGLGVTEGSMTGALHNLGGDGATPAVAAAITILCRLTTFWVAIVLGFAALAVWRARHPNS